MGRLLRRKLRCHGCGESSSNNNAGVPHAWICSHCEAVNHVDERGQITDPPVELTAKVQPLLARRARSPTPDMPAPLESPFCDRCQRNHLIVNKALAEYLPDSDDPQYAQYEATLDQYKAQLEERYPPVCETCIEKVQAGIRQAGYAAKADDLRRKLDQSKKYQTKSRTTRQFWTLVLISVAKWAYLSSVLVNLIWHGFGAIADFSSIFELEFDPSQCLSEAIFYRGVNKSCAVSLAAQRSVLYALVADALTIWWNPKLSQKVNHPSGRMRNLVTLWIVRFALLLSNIVAYFILGAKSVEKDDHVDDELVGFYHLTHQIIFAIQLFMTCVGWNIVTIRYVSAKDFLRPHDAYLPTAPRSAEKQSRKISQVELPDNTSFDSMAAGFASSFPDELNAYPPSPTLTAVSVSDTIDSEATPYRRKSSTPMAFADENAMDWTPTQSRFSADPPSLIQPKFSRKAEPPEPPAAPTRSPVSIFNGLDQNPFRRRVPAAPKAPAAAKVDPWRRGAWAPFEERKRNFFEEDKQMNEDLGTGLKGRGVPKQVEREAQFFAPPKFKYDTYTEAKDTGLEDTFNGLFSK
ncbi:hypothetical protein N0V90_008168 [Kalmusia sp. IMI 367209]|nr:hypothetical protein N0V90_008168 [Kalmusia sp. IMI 367209]